MSWKSFHKDYFSFSRAERYGILGLCGLILLMLFVRLSLSVWTKPRVPDTAAYAEEIAKFRQAAVAVTLANESTETSVIDADVAHEFFYFDPNRTTDEDWKRLGMNERQIRNIRNYQASGGNFKRKEDLQKLYTIPAAQYRLLEPYIRFSGNETAVKPVVSRSNTNPIDAAEPKISATTSRNETRLHIELNTADSSALTQLSGIGPVLAARTVRYRNLIGGFIDVAQLGEVYGINPELVERLTPQLSADTSQIKRIPVNTATLRELSAHPYLSEQQARGILNYRRLQNHIHNTDELVRNNILQREDAEKIKPYLTFE